MKIIRTTNLIPINKQKTSILLIKTSLGEGQPYKWTFPGQVIKKDDNIDEIITKISEDGLGTKINKLIKFNPYQNKTKNAIVKSQYDIAEIDMKITLNTKKYPKAEWHTLNEEIYFLDFLYNEKDIIADLFEHLTK
jgi:hypothetical protein